MNPTIFILRWLLHSRLFGY